MTTRFEIRAGRRTVSTQYSISAMQAVVDYVRSFGCGDNEIIRTGTDSVAWRGARYQAVPVADDDGPSRSRR